MKGTKYKPLSLQIDPYWAWRHGNPEYIGGSKQSFNSYQPGAFESDRNRFHAKGH